MGHSLRTARPLVPALLALAIASCAVGGGPASQVPPSLAERAWSSPIRENMRPEHRVFYDMLEGQGDWVLIEPYGYVFRPDVNFLVWRPYVNGYWVPSDSWGWVWVSTDDFGWATDHYGRWIDDRFQGWVWIPDVIWGPAWVQWAGDDDYVGWAPMLAVSTGYDGGAYTFVPAAALGSTDLGTRVVKPEVMRGRLPGIQPIERVIEREGVKLPAGPRVDWVERRSGPLRRARIEDLVAPGALTHGRPPTAGDRRPAAAPPAGEPAASDTASAEREARLEARRAAARAADEERDRAERGAPAPERVPVVRPFEASPRERREPRPVPPARDGRPRRDAPPDSTR